MILLLSFYGSIFRSSELSFAYSNAAESYAPHYLRALTYIKNAFFIFLGNEIDGLHSFRFPL